MAITIKRKGSDTKTIGTVGYDPLAEAKQQFQKELPKGTHCPCCGRPAGYYRVNFNNAMVEGLAWIAKEGKSTDTGWVDVQGKAPRRILKARTYMKAALWGLLEKYKPGAGQGSKWRVTDKGLQFLRSEIRIPKAAMVYDGKVQTFIGDECLVHQLVNKSFDLNDLMI